MRRASRVRIMLIGSRHANCETRPWTSGAKKPWANGELPRSLFGTSPAAKPIRHLPRSLFGTCHEVYSAPATKLFGTCPEVYSAPAKTLFGTCHDAIRHLPRSLFGICHEVYSTPALPRCYSAPATKPIRHLKRCEIYI